MSITMLNDEEFEAVKGNLIAIQLSYDPRFEKVIAKAPLDFNNPEIPRRSIQEQIQAIGYKGMYQMREVLTDEQAEIARNSVD